MYVIPDDTVDEKMLLGKGLTRQMDVKMKGSKLYIKKLGKEEDQEEKKKEEEEEKRNNNEVDKRTPL